ncbi:hypothetical protein PR202_gb01633 [Eleusine coracana subsp. coracana]|uniref:Endoplasmic reticulum vesicle transporter N-terminal domain-containing protein n=1 Tax=Eleusine coracana subsp. coracana TaxID=191504 RepID=A0AAV5DX74_ELECO|nr:hypothetical protein PR202_gb01633 [Eleusine coracana subsp. coracana]
MEAFLQRLKGLDAYPKVNEDFYKRTLSGGVVTVVAAVVMLLLFISETISTSIVECWDASLCKRPYPVLRAPALCGVWGRVSAAGLTPACAMRGDRSSNLGPVGYRRYALPLHQARPSDASLCTRHFWLKFVHSLNLL